MNKKTTPYIYILLALLSYTETFAQAFSLKLTSLNKTEANILNKINYQKKHKDTILLNLEINILSEHLKNLGYFTNSIDSIRNKDNEYVAFFNLGNKIDNAIIRTSKESEIYLEKFNTTENTFSIPIEKLQTTLLKISTNLDSEGKSFSKVKLKNVTIKNKTLFADLVINPSKKRTINKVIIKGYDNFPKSYLKNYFNIKPTDIFNQEKILEISDASKNLDFIKEIKSPEILFTKDSTLLYMYLKKHKNNSFDGIIGFASKENGDILFNGNLEIQLNNILNTGEKFGLFWNSIGEEKQELKLTTTIPYIFNSRFSPELTFSIYKQDSTFLNSKFDSRIGYHINSKIKLALTYNSEKSENLKENLSNNIETYSNYFLGVQLKYSIPKNDFFLDNKFHLDINPSFGNRETTNETTNQLKLEASISYLWDLNLRSSIFIKNKTGYLNSDSYINNELFRVGGTNSIRGFNEQSIFTNKYMFLNLEYRYLTSEKSYLYTITDLGQIDLNSKNENLIGLGFGYLFNTNNSQINMSLSTGKTNQQETDLKSVKLTINWKNYF
ncbi:POTRA domain-containing protein [Polaribacter sejongensis]|uniref:POTRA domain-containing protein n=1 Tax=Polaribacter sejongensis TaxID=985043 RepID=UPI001AD83A73|nr:POTRA domain-containing protein [Polaribacter sejongensis]